MTPMQRRIYIVAGPNGAGKTTFARTYLPNEGHFERFINADLIAAGISPFHPEAAAIRAGRLMLEEIAACIEQGESFAFETTLSGRSYAIQIPKWRESGYTVDLVFLRLRSVRLAVSRVKMRVIQGGPSHSRVGCATEISPRTAESPRTVLSYRQSVATIR